MNPWQDLPLEDYEGHMGSAAVGQLAPLGDIFAEALTRLRPRSVAVLGVAGGNGLEHDTLDLEPVALVHAALLFEHAGTGPCLDTAVSLVARGGHLSVVLQLPSAAHQAVTPSAYASMATLAGDFAFVDPHQLRRILARRDLRLTHQARRTLATGKVFWSGYFERA